jgi:hypothetical protein
MKTDKGVTLETYSGWQALGRQVLQGEIAYWFNSKPMFTIEQTVVMGPIEATDQGEDDGRLEAFRND